MLKYGISTLIKQTFSATLKSFIQGLFKTLQLPERLHLPCILDFVHIVLFTCIVKWELSFNRPFAI